MDFSKLLKDTAPEMGSNLTIKIGNPPSLTVRKCFVCGLICLDLDLYSKKRTGI